MLELLDMNSALSSATVEPTPWSPRCPVTDLLEACCLEQQSVTKVC